MRPSQIQRLFQQFPEFSIQENISKGWELFKVQWLNTIAFTLLVFSIQGFGTYYLKDYALLVSVVISPPLTAGYFLVANRVSRGVEVTFANYFDGFSYWGILILTSMVSGILTFLGILALVLPGIYLAVAFMFGIPFALFSGMDFWTSLELSRKLITKNWWKFFGFVIVLVGLNILGFLFFFVGLLVTIPVSYFVIYSIFEELTADALAETEATHVPQS
ncbi:DUF2189 domain-containing protein [Algoriphagus boritolerans]|uniref:Uncharacterized protein n=1 Tax=Algoriphagus boritolerans DSM 17298 = JCM 18970 TaxID=1120964 RepID=A0A1H6AG30_9BACT|nr:hypothetical protein [Algoriphagus boritolerans]SEG47124.1 hypothetical protein SAMN03080598_04096 [Algoriphagus boritolerans DSM 17298 = JCM 18970]